ncbi:peptidoglycan D,D-transpeptidase FtsI family protein [Arthrobacter sp. MI7-26]|uniref:peptidoglycan D,D-transpeptidase FtsI family protein n=1 Tax=Arthrobacter sp. MI7-26 TaxID=2993653 RepID=UPI0022494011|nr:penicillin-binding protein 2 [Arthrobacter sp. MI7-26]
MIVFFSVFALLVGRLVWVQVIDGPAVSAAAQMKRTVSQDIPFTRGEILDERGQVLARTILTYDIVTDPSRSSAFDTFDTPLPDRSVRHVTRDQGITELARILGLDVSAVKKVLSGEGKFAYVARAVTPDVEQRVADLRFPGVSSNAVQKREYPLGAVAGNLVGFVDDRMQGAAGVEQTLNDQLTGTPGKRQFETGADGILIPVAPIEQVKPVNGKNVQLTINSDLQYFAQKAISDSAAQLHADWANIVIVEAKTGKIRAMAETSPMDPNNPGASKPEDRGVRSVTAALEPGSTEKSVTAAAALQEGKVQPLTQLEIPPSYTIDGQPFDDSFRHGTLHMTFAGVLGYSLNTGTVMVGKDLTAQQRYDYLRKFGIGEKTGIPLPGESTGILASPNKWDVRQQYTVLFGQGVAQTPLQTAMVYQTIANGGVRLKPQLIESTTDANGKATPTERDSGVRVLTPETDKSLKDILESVVTAGEVQDVKVPGYRVGAKTGTAETATADGKGLNGYTASLVGMAPMEDPQYVVLVNVQHPQGDIYGISQAQVFNSVMSSTLSTYNVGASTTPSVALPQKY